MKERLKSTLYLLELVATAIAVTIWGRTVLAFLSAHFFYYVSFLVILPLIYFCAKEVRDKENDAYLKKMCFWILIGLSLVTVLMITPIGKPSIIFLYEYVVWGIIELALVFFIYIAIKSIVIGKPFEEIVNSIV